MRHCHTNKLSGVGEWFRMSVCGRRTFSATLWVNCPLWVSHLCQLSLPSLRGR